MTEITLNKLYSKLDKLRRFKCKERRSEVFDRTQMTKVIVNKSSLKTLDKLPEKGEYFLIKNKLYLCVFTGKGLYLICVENGNRWKDYSFKEMDIKKFLEVYVGYPIQKINKITITIH